MVSRFDYLLEGRRFESLLVLLNTLRVGALVVAHKPHKLDIGMVRFHHSRLLFCDRYFVSTFLGGETIYGS